MIFCKTKNKKNMLKDMDFYHLRENIENIDALKTTSKKVVHKAAEATSEEIIIPSEKR